MKHRKQIHRESMLLCPHKGGESLYSKIIEARFRSRLNRFVVTCEVDGETRLAHLPNPGRMWELLFPGTRLYIVPTTGKDKKTGFKVIGIERDGTPIMLDTHYSNTVAEILIDRQRIPALAGWQVLQREVPFGHSRFDLLLGRGEERFILEVKSCTLFGEHLAMFPDAITERGRKHMLELARLSGQGYRVGVLFLVQWSRAEYFLPDYHTDLEFAKTFFSLRDVVQFMAVALNWRPDFSVPDEVRPVAIPWNVIGRETNDGGCYIFIVRLPEERAISIGSKGTMVFKAGYYLYVGSAKCNLSKRLERHQRKRKRFHWHIDYLRAYGESHGAVAIRATADLEHELAAAVSALADWQIPGFGCSDCQCTSHLFGMQQDPLHVPRFIKLLQYFRMDRLEAELATENAKAIEPADGS